MTETYAPHAQTPPDAPKLITVREAASIAGVHENTLRRWIRAADDRRDDLTRCTVDLGGELRIRRGAFERWLDGNTDLFA